MFRFFSFRWFQKWKRKVQVLFFYFFLTRRWHFFPILISSSHNSQENLFLSRLFNNFLSSLVSSNFLSQTIISSPNYMKMNTEHITESNWNSLDSMKNKIYDLISYQFLYPSLFNFKSILGISRCAAIFKAKYDIFMWCWSDLLSFRMKNNLLIVLTQHTQHNKHLIRWYDFQFILSKICVG